MYSVCVTFQIKPGFETEFVPLVRAQARNSLAAEPDCHCFDVNLSEDGLSVFLYELYTDAAAFQAHLATEHFLQFDQAVGDMIADKSVATYNLLQPKP